RVLDQKKAAFAADGGYRPLIDPLAVRVAVTLQVDRARTGFPLAVIRKAVGFTGHEHDRDTRVPIFGSIATGQRFRPDDVFLDRLVKRLAGAPCGGTDSEQYYATQRFVARHFRSCLH